MPIGFQNGIAESYLKTMKGVETFGDATDLDRGGIVWDGVHYRAIGNQLASLDGNGTVTNLGTIGTDNKKVTLDYSFDRLAIRSGVEFYYWDKTDLTQVTDEDLGDVLDFVFLAGYFVTTDGEYIVVTELGNPEEIDPIKYGSSEFDPDPIVGLVRLAGQLYALNRYSIEAFGNVGGSGFPFAKIDGATISKGVVATQAKCEAADTFFFVGGGRGEEIGLYVAGNGRADKVSTPEIDKILNNLSPSDQANIELEARVTDGVEIVYVHTPVGTYCYSITGTLQLESPVWFSLHSSDTATGKYNLRNWVLTNGQWVCGDISGTGLGLEIASPTHFGDNVGWQFSTSFLYNKGYGAQVHDLELVGLPGSTPLGSVEPTIYHTYSNDGKTWSNPRPAKDGVRGGYQKRIMWIMNGSMRNFRSFRFSCVSDTAFSFTSLQAKLEPLNV